MEARRIVEKKGVKDTVVPLKTLKNFPKLPEEKKQAGNSNVNLVNSSSSESSWWSDVEKENNNPRKKELQEVFEKILSAPNNELLLLRLKKTIDLHIANQSK